MLCIFSCFYFLHQILIQKKIKEYKVIIKFIGISLLAGLSSLMIWLPTVSQLIGGDRYIHSKQFNLEYIMSRLFIININQASNIKQQYWNLNIYTSLMTIILFIYYYFNIEINKQEKIINSIYLVLFILSFLIPEISYIWHGFSDPDGYYFRYSFIFSFFMIALASKQDFSKLNPKILFSIIIFLICTYFFCFQEYFIIANIIFLGLYLILIVSSLKNKKLLVYFIIVIELLYSTFLNLNINSYYKERIPVNEVSNFNDYVILEPGYRNLYLGDIQQNYGRGISFTCGASVDYYSSNINFDIIKFYIDLDMGGFKNSYGDNIVPLTISKVLLGTKYIYSYTELQDYPVKEIVKENDKNIYIHENRYALPFGFITSKDYQNDGQESGIQYQNHLFKSMTGIEEDVIYETSEENNLNYSVYNEQNWNKKVNYKIDWDVLEQGFEILNQRKLENIEICKNKFQASITSNDSGIMFLSIPYDKNFNVYLDGEKVSYNKVYDTFIGFDITEGNHTISVEYKNKIISYSFIFSMCTIVISLFYFKFSNRKKDI